MESEVHAALEVILEAGRLPEAALVKELLASDKPVQIPELMVPNVDLSEYDVFTKELLREAV